MASVFSRRSDPVVTGTPWWQPDTFSHMKTLASSVALAIALPVLASPSIARDRAHRVYIPDGAYARNPVYKPSRFTPTGDGSLFFTAVRWSAYGGSVARATALGHADDCNPDCAHGSFHTAVAGVWLSRPRFLCHHYLYTIIRVRFLRAVPSDRTRDSTWNIAGGTGGC